MVRNDLVDNISLFIMKADDDDVDITDARPGSAFDRYEVNLIIGQNTDKPGAPIIEEPHPTLANLIGRIEYMSIRGALVTNFRLIKAGALHRANGGYLLLDVRSLLIEPFSWSALKRILRRGEIAIEDIARFLGFTSTVSLEPDPIPLDVKIVLFGDRLLYFLLAELDPELSEHFKVLADFENDFARTPENEIVLRAHAGDADETRRPECRSIARRWQRCSNTRRVSPITPANCRWWSSRLREVLIEADFCARQAGRASSRAPMSNRRSRRASAARRGCAIASRSRSWKRSR